MILAPSMPNYGIAVPDIDTRVFFRASGTATAVARGDLLMFNLQRTDADVTTVVAGGENSIFSNVSQPRDGTVGAVVPFGWYCVALDSWADNQAGPVRIQGIVDRCAVGGVGQTAPVIVGERLIPRIQRSELYSLAPVTAGGKSVALALTAQTTAGTVRDLIQVLFSGITGFNTST